LVFSQGPAEAVLDPAKQEAQVVPTDEPQSPCRHGMEPIGLALVLTDTK
jgi:hypothetical protein